MCHILFWYLSSILDCLSVQVLNRCSPDLSDQGRVRQWAPGAFRPWDELLLMILDLHPFPSVVTVGSEIDWQLSLKPS